MDEKLNIFILLFYLNFCFGNTNSHPDGLLERIQALEHREKIQTSRIELLEHQVFEYNSKLESMQQVNEILRQELTDKMNLLQEKDKDIQELKVDMEERIQKANKQQKGFERLQDKVDVLMKTCKIVTEGEHNTELDNIEDNGEESSENTAGLLQSVNGLNITNGTREAEKTAQKIKPFNYFSNELSKVSLNGEGKKRNNLIRQEKQLDELVAFHAVISPHLVEHLSSHETIKFDKALLNTGNNYHAQHGIFIAPRAGLYMFSVTIATERVHSRASIVKNGVSLAGILSPNGQTDDYAQGSVTVITELKTGDEVWVIHHSPNDGSIWGNYYSSFCGILLIEI